MIYSIMVLGRHLVMYWAPENESFKLAQWKSLKSILKFSPFYHKFFVFLDFLRKKMYKWLPLTPPEMSKKNFWVLHPRYYLWKKFGGYFLKKTSFSIFEGLLEPNWKIFFRGLNTSQSAYLKPWSKKSYLHQFVF